MSGRLTGAAVRGLAGWTAAHLPARLVPGRSASIVVSGPRRRPPPGTAPRWPVLVPGTPRLCPRRCRAPARRPRPAGRRGRRRPRLVRPLRPLCGFRTAAPAGVPDGCAGDLGREQPVTAGSEAIMSHLTRIEHVHDKCKLVVPVSACWPAGKKPAVEALTPASPDSLPPLGQMAADEPFWHYRRGTAGEGAAHLRVWRTTDRERSHLAVVTGTGAAARVTESAGHISAWPAGTRLPSCCPDIARHPGLATARRPSTWSASAPTAARTGCACGRRPRIILVTPGSSGGWPSTGTGSSASPRAGPAGARSRAADPAYAGLGWPPSGRSVS
jgi:hypothetical protein